MKNIDDQLKVQAERREAIKLETHRLVVQAHKEGRSVRQIGLFLKLAKSQVQRILDEGVVVPKKGQGSPLDDLPPSVADLVRACKLTPEVARQLNKLPHKKLVARLAADAVPWNWTRVQAATAARARGAELDAEDDLAVTQPAIAIEPPCDKQGNVIKDPKPPPVREWEVYRDEGDLLTAERIGRVKARDLAEARKQAVATFGLLPPGHAHYSFSPVSTVPPVSTPPADYLVQCNGSIKCDCGDPECKHPKRPCPFTRPKSEPGRRCPHRAHLGDGFHYAGTLARGVE
jgi:hypothetical protein